MTVTGLSAHSWAETWDDHRGWVTQEATPPMIAAALGDPNVLSDYNPTDSSYTQRQLEAVLGAHLTPVSVQTAPSFALESDLSKIADPFPGAPYIIVSVAAGLGLLFLLIRFSFLRLAPVERRFKRVVRKIAKRSKVRGLPDPASLGWREWSRGLIERRPGRSHVAGRAAFVIHRSFFSGGQKDHRTDSRDVVFLERLYRDLLKQKRRAVPTPRSRDRVS